MAVDKSSGDEESGEGYRNGNEDNDSQRSQVVVPESLKEMAIKIFHDMAGHPGND